MKKFVVLACMAGFLLLAWLVARSGTVEVGDAFAQAGWSVLAVVGVRALIITACGVAWGLLFPPVRRPAMLIFATLRWVREGMNTLLPVAQVGGDIAGARLLPRFGPSGAEASASVIVDLMLQVVGQFVFTCIGLAVLASLGGADALVRDTGIGLLIAAPLLIGFVLAQRGTVHRLLGGFLRKLVGGRDWAVFGTVDELYAQLGAIYARPLRLAGAGLTHFAILFAGTFEIVIALSAMGHPVTLVEALVIESLFQAVKGAAFAVPGALGVQEAGLIALCAPFGIEPDMAIALSLIKRVGDLGIGLPGLLGWQILAAKGLFGDKRGHGATTSALASSRG